MSNSLPTIGITGISGFLGWHLRCRFGLLGHEVVGADRGTFASPDALDDFVTSCDVLIHAAGVNRNNHIDEVGANADLAELLVAAMRRTGHSPTVVYTNSTHAEGTTPYGIAKSAAATILGTHLEAAGARFVDLVLPHLFGEFGRPFYNSAVTTFAHQLAIGETPTINGDGKLELLHVQDVAGRIVELLADASAPQFARERMLGTPISVADTWQILERLHDRYVRQATIPSTPTRFELQLFNALRSQLYLAGFYPRPITLHADARGAFSELCRADGVGQTSISTTVPGVTRGDHFHLDKVERFVVVSGEATIRLRRLYTDETSVFEVSGDAPMIVDMPPLTTHNITNTGDGIMTTVFWAGDHFDPANPDTFVEPVEAV